MKRLIRIAAIILAAGLIAAAVYSLTRPRTSVAKPKPDVTGGLTLKDPGGEGISLELFGPDLFKSWSLRIETASIDEKKTLQARTISATYFRSATPARLLADTMEYEAEKAALLFGGRISLTAPNLALSCDDLRWDEDTKSFRIEGGYSLTRGEAVMKGRGLLVDGDLQTVHAFGAVSLSAPADTGGRP